MDDDEDNSGPKIEEDQEGYDFELFDTKSAYDKSDIIEAFNPNVQVKLNNSYKH